MLFVCSQKQLNKVLSYTKIIKKNDMIKIITVI